MRAAAAGAVLLVAGVATGCGGSDGTQPPSPASAPRSIDVTSPAVTDGGPIPRQFTCAGDGGSPALRWTGVPATARSLALLVDDPDAPGGDFVHWLVVDLPPRTTSIAAGARTEGQALPNSAGSRSWTPPCPPSGTHHYRFTVYALDGVATTTDRDEVNDGLAAHAVAWGRLTGTVSH
jgi:Raf kinase inhibitor-like YbhB/YbcL family protein